MFKLFMDEKPNIVQRTIRYRSQHVGILVPPGGERTSRSSLIDTEWTVGLISHQHGRRDRYSKQTLNLLKAFFTVTKTKTI